MNRRSSKLRRGGGRSGGLVRNRNSFPSPVKRMSSAVPRVKSAASVASVTDTVEETFSVVPSESPLAFGMIIRLAPDLVEEIKRVEAQGETAKIKFDAFPNNSTGNIINVGGKEFKFTWSREPGDLCDIYEEHQKGEDGNGVLTEAGCAWRRLNVRRILDESTTSHMKMLSVEAEQRTKSRRSIVLDPGNPSLRKQLALAEANPRRMPNKKKGPLSTKRKVDPPPVPIRGPKPSVRPGAATPAVKNSLTASSGPSPLNKYNTPPYEVDNIVKTHAANENVTPVQKGREKMVAREKDLPTGANNGLRDRPGHQKTNVKEIDLQTLLVDLLKEAPMSLKALEKAVGDRIPNAAKKIEPILKTIAHFQAPRYFLKSGAELESQKEPFDSGSSPEHQQLLPITERNQLPVPRGSNVEKYSVSEQNGEGSQGCLPVHRTEQLNAQENVDIEYHSPCIPHEENRSEEREGQARSTSDSDSESQSKSSAGSDSGSSSGSEASSNRKDSSDEDVDIISDGEKEHRQTIQSAERDGTDPLGHTSNGIKEFPEQIVVDSERPQNWTLQSHGQNHTGTFTESDSHNKNLEVGSSLESYVETNKETPIIKHGTKRASTTRSSRESKRHASDTIVNSTNGHKDTTSTPGDSVIRTSFDEEDSSYLKYEKASPELKGPIRDHLQYKAYMQEYLDKYDSYCSVNKILETYRNDFEKLGQDLEVAKGSDTERYNKILEQLIESYCTYGERHKRLKKVFIVLHEELKQMKQRMKDYTSSHGKHF